MSVSTLVTDKLDVAVLSQPFRCLQTTSVSTMRTQMGVHGCEKVSDDFEHLAD